MVYQLLYLANKIRFKEKNFPVLSITIVVGLFMVAKFFSSWGTLIAKNIEPVSGVILEYEGVEYCTDPNVILIGESKKYIIFRNLNEERNHFFEREKISYLRTEKMGNRKS